jgi:protein phosphatase PTC1
MLAITRALGDADLKEYVSGRPFTSEVVLDPSMDTHLILACDGLWDVVTDKECIDYIVDQHDPAEAAHILVDFALEQGSTDNISVIVVKFDWGKSECEEGGADHPIKNHDLALQSLNSEDGEAS